MFAFILNKSAMPVFYGKIALMDFLSSVKIITSSIGFVPTMGALHKGHQSLIEKSVAENDKTVVSIFVNPTQFNNPEDLAKYPRTLEEDIKKIDIIDPNIIIYAPTIEDIYGKKTTVDSFDFDGLENRMEGKFRPGHFNGVGTVVKRLFEIIKPTNAYFGEKDFQQLQVVKKLVEKNNLHITIIGCPIFRESNGLAMSSRNERLSLQERKQAFIIFKTLKEAKIRFSESSASKVAKWVVKQFENNKLFTLEYFDIVEETTLKTCTRKSKNKKYRAFIAVFVNNIRLIDNISLD